MDTIELLHDGYAWTAERVAAVPVDGLDAPTPCGDWTLRRLLDHVIDVLTLITNAVEVAGGTTPRTGVVHALGPTRWDVAIAELAARSRRAWAAPEVIDRTYHLAIGTMSGPTLASSALLEAAVHGWDIGHSTGEAIEIPDALAAPTLAFAGDAITATNRHGAFAPQRSAHGGPSDQLVAFLGRTPR